jgi:hypothetical protein
MKISILLCAGAFALLLSPAAVAKSGAASGAQAHRHATHKSVRPRAPKKEQKDPWAAYWNDASRYEFPSWGYRGGW